METKFRGLKPDSKEWVYGDLLKNNNDPIIVQQVYREYIDRQDAGDGSHWFISTPAFKVIKESVGLFTGFYDGGKTELYPGDIIENDGVNYIVEWCEHTGVWDAINVYTGDNIALCELCPSNETWYQGNRFENPELLER